MNIKKRITHLLIVLFILSLSFETFPGGWTKKKGKFFLQLNSQYMSSNKLHNANGTLVDINKLSDFTLSLYAEYGITDELSLVTFFPFYHNLKLENAPGTFVPADATKKGISDSDIGIKYKISEFGQSVLTVGLSLGLPLGDSNDPFGLLTGDGEFNQQINLQFGHSFYPIPLYFNSNIGYNLRHKGYSDEFNFGVEAGYTFYNKLLLILRINGLKPLRNGDNLYKGGAGGLFANNQQYLVYGPELIYKINNSWGISASFNSGAWARNVLGTNVYRVGFFIQN